MKKDGEEKLMKKGARVVPYIPSRRVIEAELTWITACLLQMLKTKKLCRQNQPRLVGTLIS